MYNEMRCLEKKTGSVNIGQALMLSVS